MMSIFSLISASDDDAVVVAVTVYCSCRLRLFSAPVMASFEPLFLFLLFRVGSQTPERVASGESLFGFREAMEVRKGPRENIR